MNYIKSIIKRIPIIKNYLSHCNIDNGNVGFVKFVAYNLLHIKARHYCNIPKDCLVQHPNKIYVGANSIAFRKGSYFQGEGTIYIGNYVRLTNFNTILSTNHDLYNHKEKHPKPIIIHDYCWVGTHSIILAGVELGPKTIVAAGAVVTKSFPNGYCVIGGNPAKLIKTLDPDKVVLHKDETEYYGILTKKNFLKYQKRYITVKESDFINNKTIE